MHWHNIELNECDAADYVAPEPLDGVLFSLSYNTMPHHLAVLRKAWEQLRPGGRLVIMDAKVPPGPGGKLILPFSLWLMKHTMLGNPLIHPWEELACHYRAFRDERMHVQLILHLPGYETCGWRHRRPSAGDVRRTTMQTSTSTTALPPSDILGRGFADVAGS